MTLCLSLSTPSLPSLNGAKFRCQLGLKAINLILLSLRPKMKNIIGFSDLKGQKPKDTGRTKAVI